MKLFLTALIALTLYPQSAIAQLDRTNRDIVSDLGIVKASTDATARRACKEKGGNIVVKTGGKYRCYYASRLPK